jgi:hypothetical protein
MKYVKLAMALPSGLNSMKLFRGMVVTLMLSSIALAEEVT